MNAITINNHAGSTYYETVYRGSAYAARFSPIHSKWEVMTSRLALGSRHVPSVHYFDTVEELCAKKKAFSGLAILIDMDATTGSMILN